MKSLLYVVVILTIAIFALIACDKDSKRDPGSDVLHPRTVAEQSTVSILD